VQAPLAIKGRVIEDIVNDWAAELQAQTQAFAKHASEVV
jgi:hypothetical protein